ncbi:MAG: hypothetical protein PVI90_15915, partial [Desulfobacteraceae bacterium]
MPIDPKRQLPSGDLSSNAQMFDALLRHQIYVLRTSGAVRNDVVALLNAVEKDLAEQIRIALASTSGTVSARLKQAQSLIVKIKKLRKQQWGMIDTELASSLSELVNHEVGFLSKTIETVLPITYNAVLPSAALLRSLTTERPFRGRILKEWVKDIVTKDLRRIEDQIKIGIVQGENGNSIVRR